MIQNRNQDIDVYCLVLEYATNGSLNDFIIDSFKIMLMNKQIKILLSKYLKKY